MPSCSRGPSVEDRLSEIDRLLQTDPSQVIDSLYTLDAGNLKGSELAYYNLLLTIAQHKNRIPFTSDSLISFSRKWFGSNGNTYHYARACFYHGLVTWITTKNNESACESMRQSLQILSDCPVDDERLEALICAYLGQVNDYRTLNLPEAAGYYRRAIELESRLNNGRNRPGHYATKRFFRQFRDGYRKLPRGTDAPATRRYTETLRRAGQDGLYLDGTWLWGRSNRRIYLHLGRLCPGDGQQQQKKPFLPSVRSPIDCVQWR